MYKYLHSALRVFSRCLLSFYFRNVSQLEPAKKQPMQDMPISNDMSIEVPKPDTKLPNTKRPGSNSRKMSESKESSHQRGSIRQSPSRRRSPSSNVPPVNAASSFDRVAAWVKDVSLDLTVATDKSEEQCSAPSRTQKHRSHSGDCSWSERRQRSYRKGHRRHRGYRDHSNSSVSVCAKCQRCEPEACEICNQSVTDKDRVSKSSRTHRPSRKSEHRRERRGSINSMASSTEEVEPAHSLQSPIL